MNQIDDLIKAHNTMKCNFCGLVTDPKILSIVDDGFSKSKACPNCIKGTTNGVFVKHDNGKPQWSLLPWQATEEVIRVLEHGATKYGAYNWRKGTQWRRYIDAAMRHLMAFNFGEDSDKESGFSHLAHAVCCLLFLIDFQKSGRGTDDRIKDPDTAKGGLPF